MIDFRANQNINLRLEERNNSK